jgi:succinate dehydrogenase / fumarate reductase flavoprotein subunit
VREGLEHFKGKKGEEKAASLRRELQETMTECCGVYRDRTSLHAGIEKVQALKDRYGDVMVEDPGNRFNTALLDALELESLLNLAEVILISALAREESRGAHFREDFPERDDGLWLKHTLVTKGVQGPQLSYKPVSVTRFEPKPRVY